jgi:hypothetical protein
VVLILAGQLGDALLGLGAEPLTLHRTDTDEDGRGENDAAQAEHEQTMPQLHDRPIGNRNGDLTEIASATPAPAPPGELHTIHYME